MKDHCELGRKRPAHEEAQGVVSTHKEYKVIVNWDPTGVHTELQSG